MRGRDFIAQAAARPLNPVRRRETIEIYQSLLLRSSASKQERQVWSEPRQPAPTGASLANQCQSATTANVSPCAKALLVSLPHLSLGRCSDFLWHVRVKGKTSDTRYYDCSMPTLADAHAQQGDGNNDAKHGIAPPEQNKSCTKFTARRDVPSLSFK